MSTKFTTPVCVAPDGLKAGPGHLEAKSAPCNLQEAVTGVVRLDVEKSYSHSGVKCRAMGRMIMNPNKGGQKEIVILDVRIFFATALWLRSSRYFSQQDVELVEAGKFPEGDMEIPFEFTVEPCSDLVRWP